MLAFAHFGGVPALVRYDNLKPAVTRVLRGRDRVESERFVALRSHYGFDSFFCRPGIVGAHEKGGVEGEIGRFRRRHLVPVPKVTSLAALNTLITAADLGDETWVITGRRYAGRRLTIRLSACVVEVSAAGRSLPVMLRAQRSIHRSRTASNAFPRHFHAWHPQQCRRHPARRGIAALLPGWPATRSDLTSSPAIETGGEAGDGLVPARPIAVLAR